MKKEEIITKYSQRFGIPERSIDETIIPILLVLDENTNVNKALTQKVVGSITHEHIHFANKWQTFWFSASKLLFPSLATLGCVWGLCFFMDRHEEREQEYINAKYVIERVEKLKIDRPRVYHQYFE